MQRNHHSMLSNLFLFSGLGLLVGFVFGYPAEFLAAAARGEKGIVDLLNTFKGSMDVAMALTGTPNLKDLSPAVFDT